MDDVWVEKEGKNNCKGFSIGRGEEEKEGRRSAKEKRRMKECKTKSSHLYAKTSYDGHCLL